MAAIPFPWPATQVVDSLVQKSSGYFIYASTIIKFIDDRDFRPTERLKVIMGIKEADDESPFAALDLLYTQILSQIPACHRLLRILTVVTARFDLSIGHIEQLLGLEPGDVRLTLRGLHSLIHVRKSPSIMEDSGNRDDSFNLGIFVHHASFYDFLQDPRRAGIFCTGCDSCKTDLSRCIFQKLSYPKTSSTQADHLVWYLDGHFALEYIISSEPSSDLISLLCSFDPEPLFRYHPRHEIIDGVLNWLKKSQPLPEDLIQVWQEYKFMDYFESIVAPEADQVTQEDWNRSYQVLSQASPLLLRILRAGTLIYKRHSDPTGTFFVLFDIHFLLDISWDELRMAICSLRSFTDGEIANIFVVAKESARSAANFGPLMLDLTRGALRLVQKVLRAEWPSGIKIHAHWSWYLQQCPPSLHLLQDVQPLAIHHPCFQASDHQRIIQWLKVSIRT
ncbi:NACHT domain-containing protein [Mycena sanguinolenta]|uniref:NACHT domain-containing protein n=1 Tax=Mycena sanguinolenta TaxID=230812 RepID=A0A8H6WY50_9AGAR|nr:NACHT domain-containing protein [Mycena sanguinolenta]